MPACNDKILVGLVSPEVLSAIESDPMHPVFLDLQACSALEIRYDFFEESLWPGLSARVRKVAPHAMQIGTIRLKRDGGAFQDSRAGDRLPLWKNILGAEQVPGWLDLEQDCLYDYEKLSALADRRDVKILISQHNFSRTPTDMELRDYARDVSRLGAEGLKIAAMCNSEEDCDRLYRFTQKFSDLSQACFFFMLKKGRSVLLGINPHRPKLVYMERTTKTANSFLFKDSRTSIFSFNGNIANQE